MIVFSSVTKAYGGSVALNHVNFAINPGEFVFITGPSGAGKSTIVHLLIRAEMPTEGKVEIDGVDLATVPLAALQMFRRRTGVLFQDYKLLFDRTVEENVAFAMEVCGDSDELIHARVPQLLRRLRLEERVDAFPHELSGGEKARTALARALVHHPRILIADEPTGNIDPAQSLEILELLKQVHAGGATVIVASHDQPLIDAMNTRVIGLKDGKIVRDAVGGYMAAMQASTAPAARKHEIFNPQATDDPPDDASVKISEVKHPSAHSHRGDGPKQSGHIKPIAI